jgi:hypothetical protein
MTEPGIQPAGDGPDPGPVASLWGALLSPEATFRALARRPRWAVALIVLVILAIAFALVLTPRMDMEKVVREALEESGQEVSESQIEQQVALAEQFGWVGVASQVLLQPGIYLLMAAIFLALFRMLGSELDFRRSLSVTVHGFLPYGLATLLSIPVVLARQEVSMEEVQSASFLKSSLAALAPEESGKALLSLLGSIDLFSIWTIALLAFGFRIVGRVSRGAAWGVVLTLWALYVAGKTALSAAF